MDQKACPAQLSPAQLSSAQLSSRGRPRGVGGGVEAQEEGDARVHTAKSLHSTAETNPATVKQLCSNFFK